MGDFSDLKHCIGAYNKDSELKPTLLIEGQGSLIRQIRPRSAIVDPSSKPLIISDKQLNAVKDLLSRPTTAVAKRRHLSESYREQRRHVMEQFDKVDSSVRDTQKEDEKIKLSKAAIERAVTINVNSDEALRKASSVVLGAKCFAVRDAQLEDAEKRRKQQEDEENAASLGGVNIFESLQQREERDKEKRLKEGKKVAEEIQKQIKAKQEKSTIFKERGNRVKELEQKGAKKVKRDEDERKMQQQTLKAQRAQEFQEHLQEAIKRKEVAKKREKEEEMAIVKYMEAKAKAEAEKEAEVAYQKLLKEQEAQKIRLLQQREKKRVTTTVDEQINKAQEEAEKKWMQREEEEQLKRLRDREAYKEHHLLACEEARERKREQKKKDLEKSIEDARTFAEKARKLDKEEECEKHEAKQKYLEAILRQMETDVERKARQRSASLDEHKKIAMMRDVQQERIWAAMKAKYLDLSKGPVEERHLGFVRTKFDKICRDHGLKPVTSFWSMK